MAEGARPGGGQVRREPIDYDLLAEDLAALAYPLRLQLLDVLESPRILSEIRLAPRRSDAGENPDRPAAKQTVLAHLEKLLETGLVKPGQVERLGKTLTTYATNPQRMYAVAEELRRLVVRHVGRGAGGDDTGTLQAGGALASQVGPRVVVVHGAYEGRAYPLTTSRTDMGCVIGRDTDVAVSLDYDPFVSSENTALEPDGDGWRLRDLGSKNGTSVNWQPLPRGGTRLLQQGDVIGVGRSLLVFYER